jgi:hypothetical protein
MKIRRKCCPVCNGLYEGDYCCLCARILWDRFIEPIREAKMRARWGSCEVCQE